MRWITIVSAVASASMLATLVSPSSAQTANFENFPDGARGTSFTDPASGILFSDPLASVFPSFTTFVPASFFTNLHPVEASHPSTGGGNVLANSGTQSGSAYGFNFCFTMTLPRDTNRVSMDVAQYGPGNGIRVELYDASNTFLTSAPYSWAGGQRDSTIVMTRPTGDIRKVKVVATNYMYASYDNIIVPEPAAIGAIVGAGAMLLRRWK